ncbi:hypothetical protein ACFQ1L_16665 [Phytohabitans flavus]|uniref:hypothetical protein n=1 Tax=Phytohabitans flavus TaxID=1076124 RepID=UPI001E4A648A|nr:hypothetical protein [Phytohabitans flavus]
MRTSPATARERVCGGQASTVVTCGASVRGMAACALQGRPPRAAAATAIRLATLPDGGPTGSFFNDDGVIPW